MRKPLYHGNGDALPLTKGKLTNAGVYQFSKKAIENLDNSDQWLFQRFGQNSIQEIPFDCLHHAFEAQVQAQPHAIALLHEGTKMTYGALNHYANQLAKLLVKHGIKQGDHVGIFLQRSTPMIVGILATLKVGAAYVPQHVGVAPESQLNYVIKTAKTKVILTISSLKHLVPVPEGHINIVIDEMMEIWKVSDVLDYATFDAPDFFDGSNKCFVLFTSGTTGNPNGVQVTHRNVANLILSEPGRLGMRSGMKVSQLLNIAFDMAAWEILGCLCNGATLVIRGKDIPETAEKVDVIIGTPSVLSRINPERCKSIQFVAVAGEPCPLPLANSWAKKCTFYNSCGPTETTIVNTMSRCLPDATEITIGRPTPNNTVYILDAKQKPLPIGEIGQMWGGGNCVSEGYLNNSELTDKRYAKDPFLADGRWMFATGDLGKWTQNGELEHHGRIDDQVKVGGFRVELDPISRIIETANKIEDAITLKYDSKNLVSFVSPMDSDITDARLRLEKALPYYSIPTKILPLKQFPITERGKTDKKKLQLNHSKKMNQFLLKKK